MTNKNFTPLKLEEPLSGGVVMENISLRSAVRLMEEALNFYATFEVWNGGSADLDKGSKARETLRNLPPYVVEVVLRNDAEGNTEKRNP